MDFCYFTYSLSQERLVMTVNTKPQTQNPKALNPVSDCWICQTGSAWVPSSSQRSQTCIQSSKLNKENGVAALIHYGSCHHRFPWIQSWFLQWNQNRGPNHIWRVTSFFRIASFCPQEIIFFAFQRELYWYHVCTQRDMGGVWSVSDSDWKRNYIVGSIHFTLSAFVSTDEGRAPLNPLTSTSQAF